MILTKENTPKKKKIPSKIRDAMIRKAVWDNIVENYEYVNILGVNTMVKVDSKKKKHSIQ